MKSAGFILSVFLVLQARMPASGFSVTVHRQMRKLQNREAIYSALKMTSADSEDLQKLPSWLSGKNKPPPYWLLSDDLPAWFHNGGPPSWMCENAFKPPTWMLNDEIPSVITNTFKDQSPPLWLLNMDKLPAWFYEVDILPRWVLALGDNSPPEWILQDDIPVWLKKDEIPQWLHDEPKVAQVDKWYDNFSEGWPKWMSRDDDTFQSWMEKIPNRISENAIVDEFGPFEAKEDSKKSPLSYEGMKDAVLHFRSLYGNESVPRDYQVPESSNWPEKMWGIELGKFVHALNMEGVRSGGNESDDEGDDVSGWDD